MRYTNRRLLYFMHVCMHLLLTRQVRMPYSGRYKRWQSVGPPTLHFRTVRPLWELTVVLYIHRTRRDRKGIGR